MKHDMTISAVILARGLGKRMRAADAGAALASDQEAAASKGMKGMIPVGRPFLEHLLASLADAGYARACLVIGPEHEAVRDHFRNEVKATRIAIELAIQEEPRGTADAVLAAEEFAGGEPFIVINSDNYYPVSALAALRMTEPPAIVGFARSALLQRGNVPEERVARFGALDIDDGGFLTNILPRAGTSPREIQGEVYASMNCWLFTRGIFDACRRVPLSARDELELPKAVQLGIDEMHMRFRVIKCSEPVLDLSSRADIKSVEARLKTVHPRL